MDDFKTGGRLCVRCASMVFVMAAFLTTSMDLLQPDGLKLVPAALPGRRLSARLSAGSRGPCWACSPGRIWLLPARELLPRLSSNFTFPALLPA